MREARWKVVQYAPGSLPFSSVSFADWEDATKHAQHLAESLQEAGYSICGNIRDRILFAIKRDSKIVIAIFDTENIKHGAKEIFRVRSV